MTKLEKMEVLNSKSIAYYSGFGGLEIKSIEYSIDNHVVFVAGAWCSNKSVHKAVIHYGNRPYFNYNGVRVPLDECIRM